MKKLCWLLACALCAGACAAHPNVPRAPNLDDLRRSALASPQDANAWRELTFAELLAPGGDLARGEAALAHARGLVPRDADLLFAQGLMADLHGHPSAALDAYLAAIESAAVSGAPDAQAMIETASYAVLGQNGLAKGFSERVAGRLTRVLQTPGLSLAARAALGEVLVPIAYRRGEGAYAAQLSQSLGCVQAARVAGPFGPRELLGFDAAPPVDPAQPLAAETDLGPGRGVRPTRTVHAHACRLNLGGGPVADGGTSLAEAVLDVRQAGDYTLRLDTPNSVELFLDGRSVLRVDRRKQLGSRVVFTKLALSAGSHRLLVRVSSRHPNPVVALAFAPYQPSDAPALAPPPKAAEIGLPLYFHVALDMARGDVLSAREALAAVTQSKDASSLFLLQRAGVALSDPLLPDGVRGDEARRFLSQAVARDPASWGPVLQLASLAAKAGRVNESIASLRKAAKRWPEVPAIGIALSGLLRSKNFSAAADRVLAHVRELVPDSCSPISSQIEAARTRERYEEVASLTEELMRCDAQNSARYGLLLEQRDWAGAQRELERLDALQPETGRYASMMAKLALAKNMNDGEARDRVIAQLREDFPRSYTAAVEQVDALAAAKKTKQALQSIDSALHAEPAAMAGLYRVERALGRPYLLQPYRKDGLAAIKAFESSGRKYDGPQVLVLDYMALRVFDDGSSIELIHTVQKAQSDEAVDHLAEVDVPDGAEVLTLRAIKPDGRILEADNIAGKNTVSLPNFAPGDYVEFEYLQAKTPADGFPNGYLGERFYFKSFEIPFHHSEMVVLMPASMPYQIDPRGPAPAVKETLQGDVRVLDFAVDQSLPLVEEPNSVSAREFIPSVRLGVRATYEALIESLRDVLADRNLYDPYYAKMVRGIVGDAAPNDYRTRAERLYSWVLANVENNNDVFAQAALSLRAKSGNRARVLYYLLGLAGVPAELALARSFAGDAFESNMADAETYDHLLVVVQTPQPIWLFTNERWAPFGFMPAVLRGQTAMLLEPGAQRVKVSDGLLGPDSRRFTVNAQLNADGSARIDVTETLHGSEAVAWRGQLEQIPEAELDHRMEQEYVSRLFPGAALSSLEITGREQSDPELSLHYVLDVHNFARPVSGGLALPSVLPSEVSANLARTATRKTTELIASPLDTIVSMSIALPKGFTLSAAPQPQTLTAAVAARPNFTDRVSSDGDTLHIERKLLLPAMRIEPKDYPVFAEFCRRVDEVEGRELLLRASK
jgi:tetratricopeptide (TPR) repeat protein